MNQFFLEQRGKEKIKELANEGMRSQAHFRSSKKTGSGFLRRLSLLVFLVLGLLEILTLLVH